MKLKVAFFFDINEIEVFCKNEVFDLTKYKNLNINFIHKKILDANLKKYSFNEKITLKLMDYFQFFSNKDIFFYFGVLEQNFF